jgi:putative membrane protein
MCCGDCAHPDLEIAGTFAVPGHPMTVRLATLRSGRCQEKKMSVVKFAAAMAACWLVATPASAQNAKPTDPQIAHIAYTAGQIDIEAAKLALDKTKNSAVRTFADSMLRDHTAVNEQALALVKKLKMTPQDNDTSKALTKQAAEKKAQLTKLSGAQFDKAYVAFHKTVNGALQTVLIPSASNAELKGLLETGLKVFQGHQQHAEHLAKDMK